MKKIIIGITAIIMLLAYSTGYADSSSNKSVVWYNGYFWNIESNDFGLFNEHDKLLKAEREEQQLAMRANEKVIRVLSEKNLFKVTREIEDYHLAYYTRLAEIEATLDDSRFNEFTTSKQEQLQREIERDVAGYLSELLSE